MDWVIIEHFSQKHPIEAVQIIENIDLDSFVAFSSITPQTILKNLLPYLSPGLVAALVHAGHHRLITTLILDFSAEKITAILSALNKEDRKIIIESLDERLQFRVNSLLEYGNTQVGSLAEPCQYLLHDTATVESALNLVMNISEEEKDSHIYIINHENELVGEVDLLKLVKRKSGLTLSVKEICKPLKYKLPAKSPIVAAYHHPAWREVSLLPIVNHKNQFLGIVSFRSLENKISTRALKVKKGDLTNEMTDFSEMLWHSFIDLFE